ncbi:hypothetical protein HZ326_27325 [Fusarium oxysporum f. sp. albedinis]|nr:hypothetical protein HZ326_27325 [Fusarium oxysporum f. sp. albedinis]
MSDHSFGKHYQLIYPHHNTSKLSVLNLLCPVDWALPRILQSMTSTTFWPSHSTPEIFTSWLGVRSHSMLLDSHVFPWWFYTSRPSSTIIQSLP